MKNMIFGIIPFIIILANCVSSSQLAQNSNGINLDQAIAEAAIRIDERIPAGSKIAPLNFNSISDRFSSYVLDELTANLVDSGKLIVVDRSEIDLIRSEFDFQYSGEVRDDSMQALGRMLGAQSIVSGSLTDIGGFYRIMIRVLNVQTAAVEVQYRSDIVNDNRVRALMASGSERSQIVQPIHLVQQPQITATPIVPIETFGIVVEGATFADKLRWLDVNAIRNTEYTIVLTRNENISPQIISFSGRNNITIWIVGSERERIITLSSSGALLTIDSGVTLILGNNITFRGRSDNNSSLIRINNGGELIMNSGSKITGNANVSINWGGGVYIASNAVLTMNGGEISGNTISSGISTPKGGGVYVDMDGSFIMQGGEIAGNEASGRFSLGSEGGGVYVAPGANFRMEGGKISGNSAGIGGGVNIFGSNFTMIDGIISGNSASSHGGGVYINGNFLKTGGIIFGFANESNANRNRVTQGVSTNDRGHAVFVNNGNRREQTAGLMIILDSNRTGAVGGWDN